MLDRTLAPQTQEIDAVSFLPAEVMVFSNGARLHRLVHQAQPVMRLEIILKAGKWYEPATGVSYLLSKMLLEGTTHYTSKQLADIVALYGASLECQHGYDRITLTLYCLSKYLPDLLPIVQEVLLAPSFPEEEFQLLQQRVIQNISVEKQKSSYLATERFTTNVYGLKHPYVSGVDEDAILTLTTQDLRNFHHAAFDLSTAEVFSCGDVGHDALPLLEQLVSSDTLGGKTKEKEKYPVTSGPKEDYIPMPESLQSSIRVGCTWPRFDHPDYQKLNVLNKVLGGYFGSRLMKNIREDKGFTYGIYSTLSPKERSNLFFIGTDVNFANTDQTLKEIYKEILTLQKELVPDEELEIVKKYMVGKFLGDINTIFEQCDRYKTLVLHQLPPDYYTNLLKTVRSVSSTELRDLAVQYWDTSAFYEVVAGRKE
jgi:zinc protease